MSEFPCRLYLSAPAGHPVDELLAMLKNALAAHDVAAVLYTPENDNSHDYASTLMQSAVDHGAAFIVEQDIAFAREIGADGVHISGPIDTYKKARSELGDDRIIGLTTALNRHDSMCIGETGADYIFFDPDLPGPRSPDSEYALEDLIDWWSGLFEVACVAGVQPVFEQNRALLQAGVDFLCFDKSLWVSRENAINSLNSISNLIAECGRKQ